MMQRFLIASLLLVCGLRVAAQRTCATITGPVYLSGNSVPFTGTITVQRTWL